MSGLRITPLARPDSAEAHDYLKQLLNSERFRKAPALRQLLEYLLSKAAEGRTNEIKESTIAIDVFERSLEFDSRLDNIVRVQAHRLRKLLKAYYEAEGASDRFHVSIPKGSYVPLVGQRDEFPAAEQSTPLPFPGETALNVQGAPPASRPAARQRKGPTFAMWMALTVGFVLGAVSVLVVGLRTGAAPGSLATVSGENLRANPLATLWGSLLSVNVDVVVSFTNPAFLWTPAGPTQIYMTYRGPISAPNGTQVDIPPQDPYVDHDLVRNHGPFYFSDSWTGTGEVLAAHRLTKLFTEAGKTVRLMRSRSMTYDDLREANVIFLGSTWANELQDKFNADDTPLVCYGRERIVNREPRPGEPAEFVPAYDPKTGELLSSYVLFSALPGVKPGTKIMASAGIQTYGTYAGIDYLTSTAGVSELIRRLDPTGRKKLPDHFQAVIRHEMLRGEPVKESLVLVRELGRDSTPATAGGSRP